MSRRWSDDEVQFVRENYATLSHRDIGVHLGRSEQSIRQLCYEHGWKRVEEWSDEEVALLRSAYENRDGLPVNIDELASKIGRLKSNISRKARSLGLTSYRRKRPDGFSERVGERMKEWHQNNEHPRGALGLVQTEEARAKLSAASLKAWREPNSKHRTPENLQRRSDVAIANLLAGKWKNGRSRGKAGRREDLGGRFFRSRWEANYARYLNILKGEGKILDWDYESKTFVFEKIKRGTRAYTPDFLIHLPDGGHEWHEVKGWMDQKSRTRLKRMAKYFPKEKIVIIGSAWFKAARQGIASVIKNWESA